MAATEWDIRGTISMVTPAEGDPSASNPIFGSILVEGKKASDTAFDKASVSISDFSQLTIPAGKGGGAIKEQSANASIFARLKPGMRVQLTFAGPVAESYPVQGAAGRLEVLSAGD